MFPNEFFPTEYFADEYYPQGIGVVPPDVGLYIIDSIEFPTYTMYVGFDTEVNTIDLPGIQDDIRY